MMPITLHLDETIPTTLRVTINGDWTWEAFYRAFDRANAIIDSRDQTIDILADLAHSTSLPPGVFWHLSHLGEHLVDNVGLIVVVTGHRLHLALYLSACGLFPEMTRTLRVTETHAMAQIMIEAQRNLKTED